MNITPMDVLNARLRSMTKDELYKEAKRGRDLLMKRKKRLREAYDREPGNLAPNGLNLLEATGYDTHKKRERGVPQVSKNMGVVQLRAAIKNIEHFKDMKTTTIAGARAVQTNMIRTAVNVPTTGKLDPQDQAKVDSFRQDLNTALQSNRDLLTDFWDGYQHFKDTRSNFKYHIETTLNDYKDVYQSIIADKGAFVSFMELATDITKANRMAQKKVGTNPMRKNKPKRSFRIGGTDS